ncbi:hypothetical protein KC19_2G146800 [Ceratodon purpureus]|uniref:Uncharacterized protein n=1 Tax=Ceratodon purpureus TaxID=3225 RepID=A0A8T0IW68_CERPU|nr:hypothetical protein KC19_2G146800 [Ceratodon purpureus]
MPADYLLRHLDHDLLVILMIVVSLHSKVLSVIKEIDPGVHRAESLGSRCELCNRLLQFRIILVQEEGRSTRG